MVFSKKTLYLMVFAWPRVHTPSLKTNIAPKNSRVSNGNLLFQGSIFRGKLLNFQGGYIWNICYVFGLPTLQLSNPGRTICHS